MQRNVAWKLCILSLFLCLSLAASRAAVTVSELTVTAGGSPYDISYILNTDATSGSLQILNASSTAVRTITLAARDLSKGLHYVRWDGKTDGGTAAPAGAYSVKASVAGPGAPAGGALLWGPEIIATGTNYPSWHGGMAIDKNVGSPYYGRIYISDYANDRVAVYNADGTFARDYRTIGAAFPINLFSSGQRGVAIGPDDRVYAYHERNPAPARAMVSFNQDFTDFQQVFETDLIPRQFTMTGAGDNRRFYFTGGTGVWFQKPGETVATLIIDNAAGAATAGGTTDGIVVLDSNNDPAGHANSVTIFVRTNATGGATSVGLTTVTRWDATGSDPETATYAKTWTTPVNLDPTNAGFTGMGLGMGPDGNLWTSLSTADVNVRGFVKLSSSTGAELDRITGAPVTEKPRSNTVDQNGNVVATLLPDSISSTRGRDLAMFAPASGDTTFATTAPVTVTGTALTPITITAGPTVTAASTSAKVTWTTSEAATAEVLYGSSATSLPNRIVVSGTSITHSVTIPDLTVLNQYFYQVRSTAPGKASAISDVLSFTTKNPPATISNIQATTTTTSAKITWTTDQPTDSAVIYGATPDALTQAATGTANTTSHTVNVSGLTPGTTYYMQVQSGSATLATATANGFFATLNAAGLKVRTLTSSGDFKFGLMDDVLMTNGDLTLNKKSLPSGVDDAAVPELPLPRMNMGVAAYGGYLYVFGGRGASASSTVYYAPINADGTVGAWQETTPMSDERYYTTNCAFGYNGYLYVVGGGLLNADNTVTFLGTTIMAKQNPVDGSLGPWQVAGTFPGGALRGWGAAGAWKGKAYYVGGESLENPEMLNQEVFFADIKPDGSLGAWTEVSDFGKTLPFPVRQPGFVIHDNRLMVWAGGVSDTGGALNKSVSILTADGQPQDWYDMGFMDTSRVGFASDILHGYALMVGGSDGNGTSAVNYQPITAAEVLADSTLGNFADTPVNYPAALRDLDGAAWQGRFYVIGGRTNADNLPAIDPTGQQTTAVVNFADSTTFVARGHYESPVMDLGQIEPLVGMAVTATGSGVTLSVRTAGADGVFGAWTAQGSLNPTFPSGAQARYLQFALDLTGGASAPVVSSVALTYGTPVSVITRDDAIRALSIAGGLIAAEGADMTKLNVNGDTAITLADAVEILRRANGL